LKKFLENHEKIVILGIGNQIRGDDALGSIIAQRLSELYRKNDQIVVFDGGMVPENYLGPIKKENPSHVVLIDAVDMKQNPGFIRIVKKEEIVKYHISTHAMPISFLIKYLETENNVKIILIGIQPKKMDLTQEISKEIENSIEKILKILTSLLKNQ
jgi:hydrogenase 3 maturation protease